MPFRFLRATLLPPWHYLTDVVAGQIVGAAGAVLAIWIIY
jgi:hypothetical protein